MIKCNECTHYHIFGDLIQCDKGHMNVTAVGAVIVGSVYVIKCSDYEYEKPSEPESVKIDKRTKAFREKHQ